MLEPNTTTATPTAVNGTASAYKRSRPPRPLKVPPGHVAFRLLCHSSRIGGVIGTSGSIIRQLQSDTCSKIRIEDSPSGSDDHRVVVVVASAAISRKIVLAAAATSATTKEDIPDADGGEFEVSPAQEAVIRVFERIIEVAAEGDGISLVAGGLVSCRLLAEPSQAGSVIGKGGKVVEKIRKDTGCKIKVLSSEKFLSSASPTDEMVEIEGDILGVKKALVAVSRCLQEYPYVDRTKMIRNRPLEAVSQEPVTDLHFDIQSQRSLLLQNLPTSSVNYSPGSHPLSLEAETVPSSKLITPQQEVVFRILCSCELVGGVIGKGGAIIRALESDTGASITVGTSIADCDERLITISAMENPESRHSPAQRAAVLVFSRSVEVGIERGLDSGSKGSPLSARLVVPSNHVGCLLGKGGAIVSEMRKVTGAGIKIIGSDQVPKCASENNQVVQITGELVNVQDALYNITGRLRDNLLLTKTLNGAGSRSNSSVLTDVGPYGRVRNLSSSLGLQSSHSVSHNANRHIALTQSMDHLRRPHIVDRPTSPRLRALQTVGGVNQRSMIDVGRGLSSVTGGMELGSGNRSAIVMNTTVEIGIPDNVIGSVYGENGSNLARLRQISGAKVILHEPRPGTTDRIVVISGTPDETQAAQSLLQAFILKGHS